MAVSHAATSSGGGEHRGEPCGRWTCPRLDGDRGGQHREADGGDRRAVPASHTLPATLTMSSSWRADPCVNRVGTDDRAGGESVPLHRCQSRGGGEMGIRPAGRFTVTVVALWSTAALAGCGMVLGEGGTKAGGQSLPVTLHLGTVESGQPPYRLFVEEFAREVERRSEGAIRVAVDWQAIPWRPESERTLAAQVDAGDIDLALLPDRILPGFGASALDAVHTPFLIDSMALADAVASGELGVAMLADIPLSSVGLALVPEDLRYPAGYGRALTAADDFLGLRTRTAVAEPESSALLQALGAIPVAAQSLGEALSDGLVDAAETAYPYVRDFPDGMIYTANMAFFPKMNVLVAAQRSFDALPAQQQDLLRDAAIGEGHRGRAAPLRA